MRVDDFGGKVSAYRYRVSIPYSNKTPLIEVLNWVKENCIHCTMLPGCAYFHNERDVVHFILRWS